MADASQEMRGIVGLANLGNTCYMNAAIQAFRSCPEWTLMCKKNGPLEQFISDTTNPATKVLAAYQELVQGLWAGSGPAQIRPLGFQDQLKQVVTGTIYEDFIRRTPQDAHEFLLWLLDQMQIATQKERPMNISNPDKFPPMILQSIQGWKAAFEKQQSPLTDLIFGMLRIQQTCGGCKTVHTRWEPFNILKIAIGPNARGQPPSLMECFTKEFQPEVIEGQECDACKGRHTTQKRITVWKLPRVLLVTLKRFTPMGTRENIPLAQDGTPLQIGNFFAPESEDISRKRAQNLFATIDHHGHHMGGHQTAQTLNPVWKKWHRQDDEAAIPIEKPQFGPQTQILCFR